MTTYNFSNLSLEKAVAAVVKTANLKDGNHRFYLSCKDGLLNTSIFVENGKITTYSKYNLTDYVLAGIRKQYDNGDVEYHEEIISRARFETIKELGFTPIYDKEYHFLGYAYTECEDLLADW